MEPNAYISQYGNPASQMMQGSSTGMSKNDALNALYAIAKEEAKVEVNAQYQKELDKKDQEIARLKALLSKCSVRNAVAPPFNYDVSCFPKPNGDTVIEAVIELANAKREGNNYVINRQTDWYMVWKVLKYFYIYTGSAYDFLNIVNECVLPQITDGKHRSELHLNECAIKAIKRDSPMKKFCVDCWRKELEKQRETDMLNNKRHGTYVLDRGVNIMVRLQQLLQERRIESRYYEKSGISEKSSS